MEQVPQQNLGSNSLIPWNSKDFPVKNNSIRYNQDNTLFTLATSRGYKIFSTKNLKQAYEETAKIRELDDLEIVMTYYCTSLVFFIPTKNNKNFNKKELILFDDRSQKIIFRFKSKDEDINFFYVGKYAICIALETQIIIVELLTLKIVYIISNIVGDEKLCSSNSYGFIAFTKKNEKYNAYIKILNVKDNKIISLRNKILKPNFEYLQSLHISPSGQFIALSSLFGNKIHIYYIENLILKECLYLGDEINTIEKISFAAKGEFFFLIQLNKKILKLFQLSNIIEGQFRCKCYKYKNDEMIKEVIQKKEKENSWINYFKNIVYTGFSNNIVEEKEIDLALVKVEVQQGILFTDFAENEYLGKDTNLRNKEIVIINGKGFYYKYLFNNEQNKFDEDDDNYFELINSFQWA